MFSKRRLVSDAEFLSLPESTEKVELVDGEVIVSPSPSPWHQRILGRLFVALSLWADRFEGPVTVLMAPTDVRLRSGRIVQPDLMVFFARIPREHEGPIDRVPEICVEVLSSNRAYDRVTKRYLYAEAGVREYWVVEPGGLIERWEGPDLSTAQEIEGVFTTPLLPGFSLDVATLFRE